MKISKSQLEQIIKEEVGKVEAGGEKKAIDEFAKELGVAPLGYEYTSEELVKFVTDLLAPVEMEPTDLPLPGHEKYARTKKDHPLTTSGVGFALEKLIKSRRQKEPSKEIRDMLAKAHDQLLNIVSPTGRQAEFAQTARDATARRADQRTKFAQKHGYRRGRVTPFGPGSSFGHIGGPVSFGEMKISKSQLEQIIREETVLLLKEESKVQVDLGLSPNWKAGTDSEELTIVLSNHLRSLTSPGGDKWSQVKLAPEKLDAFRALIAQHIKKMDPKLTRHKEKIRELFFSILPHYGLGTEEFKSHGGHSDPVRPTRIRSKQNISREEAAHLARTAREITGPSDHDMWGDPTFGTASQKDSDKYAAKKAAKKAAHARRQR